VNARDVTPPYQRYLTHLIRPFPNYDFFFIKSLRQKAVAELQLKPGSRVLDAGCGPGGTFPYLVEAVGRAGEVVGVEISPEVVINATRRIGANGWNNVRIVVGDGRTVKLDGKFDGLVMFAAPDIYASADALANLLPYLNADARMIAFGAKLSRRPLGQVFNLLFRSLMKLSFESTPKLTYEPWSIFGGELSEVHVEEYMFGCMFLAWGQLRKSKAVAGTSQ
jgi:SAM-dependent methyltransferase